MKSVQECWQTWETPEIVSQSVPQITVATEVYMRSPWVVQDIGVCADDQPRPPAPDLG
jgi:hypothetical protein